MSRRSNIASIFTSEPVPASAASAVTSVPAPAPVIAATDDEASVPPSAPASRAPQRASTGPVRKLGENLQRLETLDRVEAENKALREALASGATVLDLDPAVVEGSFVRDRLGEIADLEVETLQRSIEERGQEVPILVRSHPTKPDHYQVAYGHRRLKAVAALGGKVRAVVREMTDAELVYAQGIENSERKNLSFIERAHFAAALEAMGFDRDIIVGALCIDKTELARLLVIARSVPEPVVRAIGPAPKAGRERWTKLAKLLEEKAAGKAVAKEIGEPDFAAADSDTRFIRVLAAAAGPQSKPPKAQVTKWQSELGPAVAKVTRSEKGLELFFDAKSDPGFADFVTEQLDELYSTFRSRL